MRGIDEFGDDLESFAEWLWIVRVYLPVEACWFAVCRVDRLRADSCVWVEIQGNERHFERGVRCRRG